MSRGDLFLLVAVLALFGIADSAYLAWEWYAAASASWCDFGSFFSCSRVRESPYAAVAGIPTAWIGIVGFAVLLVLAVVVFRGIETLGPWKLDRWILGFAAAGMGIGILLTLVELFVIQALCILCALAFLLDVGILGTAAVLIRPEM